MMACPGTTSKVWEEANYCNLTPLRTRFLSFLVSLGLEMETYVEKQ